jgi:hypothetical protein
MGLATVTALGAMFLVTVVLCTSILYCDWRTRKLRRDERKQTSAAAEADDIDLEMGNKNKRSASGGGAGGSRTSSSRRSSSNNNNNNDRSSQVFIPTACGETEDLYSPEAYTSSKQITSWLQHRSSARCSLLTKMMIVALVIAILFNAGVASSYRKLTEAEEMKLAEEVVEEARIAGEKKLAEAAAASEAEANKVASLIVRSDCEPFNTKGNDDYKFLTSHPLQCDITLVPKVSSQHYRDYTDKELNTTTQEINADGIIVLGQHLFRPCGSNNVVVIDRHTPTMGSRRNNAYDGVCDSNSEYQLSLTNCLIEIILDEYDNRHRGRGRNDAESSTSSLSSSLLPLPVLPHPSTFPLSFINGGDHFLFHPSSIGEVKVSFDYTFALDEYTKMVSLNETHFDYRREDFRGERGSHNEVNNQESVGEKFTDCNTTCNKDREELLTHALLYCEHAIDNPSANLYDACVQGTVRAYVQNCHLICSKAGNLFSSNEGCSGIRVKYWCKKVSSLKFYHLATNRDALNLNY